MEWLTPQVSSTIRSEPLRHMTSTMRMILCSGSFALANTVPLSALNLRPHAGHLYRARPPAEAPSSQQPPCPQAGHAGARPHLSMSPSIVSAPYFSRQSRVSTASLSTARPSSPRPSTSRRRSQGPQSMRPPTSRFPSGRPSPRMSPNKEEDGLPDGFAWRENHTTANEPQVARPSPNSYTGVSS